ncbi:MAG TPA: hypothetical protein VGI81_17490 [Tepidisphaeraceae bacterium]
MAAADGRCFASSSRSSPASLWTLITAGLAFALLDRLLGSNGVTAEIELAGLYIPEMGAPVYPEFIVHVAPESVGAMPIASVRRVP